MAKLTPPWIAAPAVLLLGLASGWLSGSAAGDPWFAALAKPAFMPPGWAFPVAWTLLYLLIGTALGLVLERRGRSGAGAAIIAFGLQLALNLVWSPLFFHEHQVKAALAVIAVMILLTGVTVVLFLRVRRAAGLLMLPYLAWLCFAAALNFAIVQLNLTLT